MAVMQAMKEGLTQRGIAAAVWGEEEVARHWTSEGWMRSQVRRWIAKARALDGGGWRDDVP